MAHVTMHADAARDDAELPPGHFRIVCDDGRCITSKSMLKVREEMALSEYIGADTWTAPLN